MDSIYIDPRARTRCSHSPRSRSNSRLSATASQFQDLKIHSPVRSTEAQKSTSLEAATVSPPILRESTSQDSYQNSSAFISSPVPHQYTPIPILAESDFDTDWQLFSTSTEEQLGSPPLLRLDPFVSYSRDFEEPSIDTREPSPHSISFPTADMSAVGIQQYDSRFEPTGVRQSCTWPQFDLSIMGDQFLEHQQQHHQMSSSMASGQLTPYDDPKLMPIYARSLSDSPPRGNLTAIQRELKRQQDHARRNSKDRLRRDRSLSNPYSQSQRTSPHLSARSVTEYPPKVASSTHFSQDSSSLSTSAYLAAPYSSSLVSDERSSDIYDTIFPVGSNEFNNPLPPYSQPSFPNDVAESSMPIFASRTNSHSVASSDQNSLYQSPQNVKIESLQEPGDQVRVVQSRPKPQCWEHGCNGRQFSTFSNLLRHQREKSGQAAKSSCPHCGAEFTRTTARNGHMAHEKCKQRSNS